MRLTRAFTWPWLLAALWGAGVSAQDADPPPRELPVQWITVDDGLPQGMVRALLQDRQGFLWFGTKDGLVRSDGHRLRVFRSDTAGGNGLCGNYITALLESRDGLLWVATEEHGFCSFDPRTERFSTVVLDARVDPSAAKAPRQMLEHADGSIWVLNVFGTAHVIRRSDKQDTGRGSSAVLLPLNVAYAGDRSKGQITGLFTFPSGDVWIADTDSLRVMATENQQLILRNAYALDRPAADPAMPVLPVVLLHDAAHHRVLLLRDDGIQYRDERTGAPLSEHTIVDLRSPSHCLLDSKHRLWMGTDRAGNAARVDLNREGVMEHLAFAAQNRAGALSTPYVISWLEDAEGNIWAGTGGIGMVKYVARSERFERLRVGRYSTFTQPDLAGRYIVVGEEHTWLNAPGGRTEVLAMRRALHAAGKEAVWGSVVVDPNGVQWASAITPQGKDHRLYRIDPGNEVGLVEVPLATGEHPCDVLPGLGQDLWITAYGEQVDRIDGLIRLDARSGKVLRRYQLPEAIMVLEYRGISDWRVQPDGTLLMGTLEGVMILRPEEGRWQAFAHRPEDPRSLPDATIFSICPDPVAPGEFLWVGTAGKGLAKLDLSTGHCQSFTTERGLPNDVVYGILADARGNLWLSTNNGLCRLDPRTGDTRHYTRDDGLCGNEFNRYSAHRSADGRFFFGGVDGVTAFDPEDFYANERPSPTRITSLRLADRQFFVRPSILDEDPPFATDSSITHVRMLKLPYDQRVLTFTFACMDHTAPARNAYRYRLVGFSKDWTYTDGVHEATFTNLDPGDYRFEVQGRNSSGIWDPVGATLALLITPPWWGTWWFRTLVALVVLAVLFLFYRYRVAKAMEVAVVRERIARDLHDEIGSTLSSVALFSEVAKRQVAATGEVRTEMLERISASASQMVEGMNDIVWAVNSRNNDLLHVVQRMNEFAGRMAEAGGFKLDLHQEGFDPDRVLSMTQRKNLYLIFKEAVNNAARYAQCNTLTVRIRTQKSELSMRIEDDGIGMQAAGNGHPSAMGGNGKRNMRTRAAEIGGELSFTSAVGKGTIIELRFPI